MEGNYELSNGYYFHFHENDDGYDYTIYDHNGNLVDGGVLVDSSKENNINLILKQLSEFTGIKELTNNNLKEIEHWIIEEFDEFEMQKLESFKEKGKESI